MAYGLSLFLTVILTNSLVWWMHTEARKSPHIRTPDGSLQLRHGTKYLAIAIGCLIVGPGSCLLVLLKGLVSGLDNVLGLIAVIIAFFVMSLWMILDAIKTRVTSSSDGIVAFTPLGGSAP